MKTSIPVKVGDQVRVQGPSGTGHGKVTFLSAIGHIDVKMERYNGDLTDLDKDMKLYFSDEDQSVRVTHVLETVTRWVKR